MSSGTSKPTLYERLGGVYSPSGFVFFRVSGESAMLLDGRLVPLQGRS